MKKYSDSTLNRQTKTELIEMIRCLEHNCEGLQEQNDRQFKLLNNMVNVVRCKDCIFFVPESGKKDPLFGIAEVSSHCGLFEGVICTGYRDGEPSIDRTLRWCAENDFCSDGVRKEDAE